MSNLFVTALYYNHALGIIWLFMPDVINPGRNNAF